MGIKSLPFAFIVIFVFVSGVHALLFTEDAKLIPEIADEFYDEDSFGQSVAINSNTIVIGAPFSYYPDPVAFFAGSAHIYQNSRSGWTEVASLSADTPDTFDSFGQSVAVSEDIAVVGMPGSFPGAVYVYENSDTGWINTAQLAASSLDSDDFDEFGGSVAVSNNTIVVGAEGWENGAAFVFSQIGNEWRETTMLTSSDSEYVRFGNSVAIDENVIVVGSPADSTLGVNSGSVYVFTQTSTGWREAIKLLPSDGIENGFFGTSIDIRGDIVVVGSSNESAYIFERTRMGWVEISKLTASDSDGNDRFGRAVSIGEDGRTVVIGATGNQSAYIFQRTRSGWEETGKLIASDSDPFDLFGEAVAISGSNVLVGASNDDDAGTDMGAAYIFSLR